VHTPRFFDNMIHHSTKPFMAPVLDVGAEYTVTAKTTVIKSMTETLAADIINFDLPIILEYVTSLFSKDIF
jgi:hypothetical protein